MRCEVCFRHCQLTKEGQLGFCRARGLKAGKVVAFNYGLATSLALDPIEKKPLKEFYPGSYILSYGSYGCNLRCPFCQNFEISQCDLHETAESLSPTELIAQALRLQKQGNIGVAFTYNEPLVSYEYVRDASVLAHEKGLKTVLVTNGTASSWVVEEILPYIDAMNIDLKGFSEDYYHYVGGDFGMVKDFIVQVYRRCHVELTTLIVPGRNDSDAMMDEEARWIASLNPLMPLHLSRYFPRYREKTPATEPSTLFRLAAIAKKYLSSVYVGNL